jgi:hypothetical protein
MIHKLVFDATDAASKAASSNVGAYVRAADGTLITHTGAALDVNIKTSSIDLNVELDHTDGDSVALGDGTNLFTSTTVGADIGLDVNLINASIAVTATDLDIRDLAAATDTVSAWTKDGSGTAITSTVVGADTGLDVNLINATVSVNDSALANTAIKNVAETVGATVGQILDGADELASRKYVYIYNNGNKATYLGITGVTTANGFPVFPGSMLEARIGDAVDLYMISEAGNQDVRTLQAS